MLGISCADLTETTYPDPNIVNPAAARQIGAGKAPLAVRREGKTSRRGNDNTGRQFKKDELLTESSFPARIICEGIKKQQKEACHGQYHHSYTATDSY